MKKGHLLIGGLGLAAAGLWYYFREKERKNPEVPTSQPGNYQPSQPSQMYPWQPIVPPRVDNANQPWYSGPRGFMSGPAEDLSNVALFAQSGASIVHSVGDIWGNFDDFFGGGQDSVLNLTDAGSLFESSPTLPGIGHDQSNILGGVSYG